MTPLHPALKLARKGRLAEDPLRTAPPHELWNLCEGNARLYSHAMEEAGHVTHMVGDHTPTRRDPCYYCGWTPMTATVAIVDYGTPLLASKCRRSIYSVESRWLVGLSTVDALARGWGYSESLAYVLDKAKSPILIACNADVEFPLQGIEELLALFEERPRLGVLGPRQVNPRGFIAHAGIEQAGDTSGGRCYGQLATPGLYTERFTEIEQVSGSVMLIRREAYEDVGGFANMPKLYYEDALLCHRMRRSGWEVGYSGAVTFLHHVAASPSERRNELAAEGRRAWFDELAGDIPPIDLHLPNVRPRV